MAFFIVMSRIPFSYLLRTTAKVLKKTLFENLRESAKFMNFSSGLSIHETVFQPNSLVSGKNIIPLTGIKLD